MTFTYPPEKYMELLKAYNELESLSFSPEDGREYVIAKLEERSAKKRQIADVANVMVREYVETFEKDPEKLTAEDAETLGAFLDLLWPSGAFLDDILTDLAISLRLGKLLAGYYRRLEDWDRCVPALRMCALTYHCLFEQHAAAVRDSPYTEEILALARRMEAGEFSGKTRSTVLKMLSNLAFTSPDRFPADRYRYIYDTFRAHMSQPPAGLEGASLLNFCGAVFEVLGIHCRYARSHGLPVDLSAARPFLEEARAHLREQLDGGQTFGLPADPLRYLLRAGRLAVHRRELL